MKRENKGAGFVAAPKIVQLDVTLPENILGILSYKPEVVLEKQLILWLNPVLEPEKEEDTRQTLLDIAATEAPAWERAAQVILARSHAPIYCTPEGQLLDCGPDGALRAHESGSAAVLGAGFG